MERVLSIKCNFIFNGNLRVKIELYLLVSIVFLVWLQEQRSINVLWLLILKSVWLSWENEEQIVDIQS